MKTVSELLTKQYRAQLERFSLQLRSRLQADRYAGTRKSRAKGSSMEFSDFRDYLPGDDLRRIDWNSAARFDRLMLKLFAEEKQADVHLVVDCSGSMAAHEQKSEQARLLAASVAWIALNSLDRVSIYALTEERVVPKTHVTAPARFLECVQYLDSLPVGGNTRLGRDLTALAKGMSRGGICFVFSDFFSEDGCEAGLQALQQKGMETVFVQLLSQEERQPTLQGLLRLTDAETGKALDVELTPQLLQAYEENRKTFEKELQGLCRKRGADFVPLNADEAAVENLRILLG